MPTSQSTGPSGSGRHGVIQERVTQQRVTRQRVTRQGSAIDAVLAECTEFRTAQDLHDELRRRQQPVGLTTVYRQLRKLADAGSVDVVTRPDGEAAYRLCGPATSARPDAHHHHLVCRVCGRTVEVDSPEVEAWTEHLARAAGFRNVTHTVEIFGECSDHP